jgi:hypothetical protein
VRKLTEQSFVPDAGLNSPSHRNVPTALPMCHQARNSARSAGIS